LLNIINDGRSPYDAAVPGIYAALVEYGMPSNEPDSALILRWTRPQEEVFEFSDFV